MDLLFGASVSPTLIQPVTTLQVATPSSAANSAVSGNIKRSKQPDPYGGDDVEHLFGPELRTTLKPPATASSSTPVTPISITRKVTRFTPTSSRTSPVSSVKETLEVTLPLSPVVVPGR